MSGAPPLLFTHPASGELRRRRWTLEVLDGADQGKSAEVDRSPALLGAAPAAVLLLSDDTVSRYHVEMDVFADGLRIRDLDSTNGTFVGHLQVRDAFIEDGGTFRLGRTTVRVRGRDEAAAPEIETDPRGVPLGGVEELAGLVAISTEMRSLFGDLRNVARSPSSVLLEGERGTGKAAAARIIHELSPRAVQPYVHLALPRTDDAELIDQLLFGHAGDDGVDAVRGAFEEASGGTLFLEHVDRLPIATQPKLVRALEAGEIQRSGDKRRRRVDVRVLSSAAEAPGHEPGLGEAALRRLAVVRLHFSPLRERVEDLPPIAARFTSVALGPRVLRRLAAGVWPENCDELAAALANLGAPEGGLREAYVGDLVVAAAGDVSRVAEQLGEPTRALFRYLAARDVDLDAA